MRIIFLLTLLLLSALPIRANGQTEKNKDYHAIDNAQAEFAQLGTDMDQTLRAVRDKASLQYTCVENMRTRTIELRASLNQYKFSFAIRDGLTDSGDLTRTKSFLKIQTNLLQQYIKIAREETNRYIGMCSKIPLAVAKGHALLQALSRTDSILGSIASQP